MRTLIRTSMVVSMALAFLCMTAPLGYTGEFLCANCGVENVYPKCPPGVYKISQNGCPDIKDVVKPTPVGVANTPEISERAYGVSPAWSTSGTAGESTVCPNCGVHSTPDSRIKALATQP
jgi:predicted RNA-binding Zn-ribbon protein involved in translation (DUF1610 family)